MALTGPLRPPVVVVASAAAESLRDLATGLEAGGCTVLRASSGQAALEEARSADPDAIVVDADLPDMDDVALCTLLRREPLVSPHTAILITRGLLPARDGRLAALRAGAWDVLAHPVDVEELTLKLRSLTRPKIMVERALAESLVDAETGLYNVQGLARRLEELGALAVRAHTALACVVLAAEAEGDAPLPEVAAFCAKAIKSGTRHSDVPGRLGTAEFAVLAPGTGEQGAIRLAQRLAGVMRTRPFKLRAGYDAVGNLAYAPVSAVDLLVRARRAWRLADVDSRLGWIRPYEPR